MKKVIAFSFDDFFLKNFHSLGLKTLSKYKCCDECTERLSRYKVYIYIKKQRETLKE